MLPLGSLLLSNRVLPKVIAFGGVYYILGKGQNYEFHNVENQKEHRKSWRRSLHRKDL